MDRIRVLVVDDDTDVLEFCQSTLRQAGIANDGATSGEQALRRMRTHLYAVVVADIHMPGISGVELISALKELSPLVQVIMVTGDSSIQQVIACADRGAVDFFAKDGRDEMLVRAVREALERIDRWAGLMGRDNLSRLAVNAGEPG